MLNSTTCIYQAHRKFYISTDDAGIDILYLNSHKNINVFPKGVFMVVLSTWFCILMARKSINIQFVPSFSGAEKQHNGSFICGYLYICDGEPNQSRKIFASFDKYKDDS